MKDITGGNVSHRRWAIIGQIRIVAGEAWDSPANMCLQASSHWLRPPQETLCVLLALDGPPLMREPLEGEALSALVTEFFSARGGVTTRLQRAVGAANRLVYEEGERVSAESGVCGGAVCLLFRHEGVYVAQIGLPRVYVSQAGTVDCLASPRPDVLLGQQEQITPHLVRLSSVADARFLLTERPWDTAALASALTKPSIEAVWGTVVALAPPVDTSACLIGPGSEDSRGQKLRKGIPAWVRQSMRITQSAATAPRDRESRSNHSYRPLLSRAGQKLWRWMGRTAREIGEGLLPGPLSAPAADSVQNREPPADASLLPHLPLVALCIPLMIALLTGLFYWRMQVADSAECAAYLRQAREILSIAVRPDTDQTAARVYVESALGQIDAALALRPDQSDAQQLREQAQRQLNLLNRVTHTPFVDILYQYPSQSEPVRVLKAQSILYVLDQGTNRIYRHRLDMTGHSLTPEETAILMHQGQALGERTVDALVDMVWLPTGEEERLLVLDMQGTLWAYSTHSGLRTLTLAEGEDLRPDRDWRLATYRERLYILMPERRQILRYPVLENSLGTAEPYFPPSTQEDLTGVKDIAIDGYIYLLWENGRMDRFLGGAQQPLPVLLPDGPLGHTPALFAHPEEETGHLYIADATRGRVIQLTKQGECVQQLEAQDSSLFTDLRSLSVDEAHGRLLIVDGHRLLLAEIPPPGVLPR
jgi:hypothetical protein